MAPKYKTDTILSLSKLVHLDCSLPPLRVTIINNWLAVIHSDTNTVLNAYASIVLEVGLTPQVSRGKQPLINAVVRASGFGNIKLSSMLYGGTRHFMMRDGINRALDFLCELGWRGLWKH